MALQGSKRRGVRASRLKLEAALADSSLERKTQVALANAIADAEGLDAAPKDLVSRVFRELPVDAQTIERVARVLGTDARSLYLLGEDEKWPGVASGAAGDPPQGDGVSGARKGRLARALSWAAAALVGSLAVALLAMATYSPGTIEQMACRAGLADPATPVPPDRLGVLIARFAGDPDDEARMLLARAFAADSSLAGTVVVDTTCRRLDLLAGGALQANLRRAREEARRALEAADADVLIWGERFGNRLVVRFATARNASEPVEIEFNGTALVTTEEQFSLPLTLEGAQPVPPSLRRIALEMMPLEASGKQDLRERAIASFANSSGWLRDAVLSDRNLLKSISYRENPRLYLLTASQLCYRYRLLGEYEGRDREFAQAEQTCRDVLARVSPQSAPSEWASLQINLGSVMVRRHLFEPTREKRIERLERAIATFQVAEPYVDRSENPDEFATYNRNLGVAFLRLAELQTDPDESLETFVQALRHTEASLAVLDPESRPTDYSQSRQNICLIQHRLGEQTQDATYFEQAIANCRKATETISPRKSPQAWAMAQNNLAISFALEAEMTGQARRLGRALAEFEKAQDVYTRTDFPTNWAEVEANKAELSCRMGIMLRDRDALRRSVAHGENALEVFRQKDLARYADYVDNLLDKTQSCLAAPDWRGCQCTEPVQPVRSG